MANPFAPWSIPSNISSARALYAGGCTPSASGSPDPGNRWFQLRQELERIEQASPFEIACAIVDYRQIIRNLQWRLNNVSHK